MNTVLERVQAFYSPFTLRHMPLAFRRENAIFPLAISALWALAATVPLFVAQWWIYSVGNAIALFVANYTLHQACMFGVSEHRPDGSYYISTSVGTPTQQ